MRLLDRHFLTGRVGPVFRESLVDVLPQFAGRIAGNIQQFDRAGGIAIGCALRSGRNRQRRAARRCRCSATDDAASNETQKECGIYDSKPRGVMVLHGDSIPTDKKESARSIRRPLVTEKAQIVPEARSAEFAEKTNH